MDHSSHSMPAGSGSSSMSSMAHTCKISMLWNWNTIDACFLSRSWHITSNGMFAGSCIGVILLVITLEALRRAGKEYDRYIVTQYKRSLPDPSSDSPTANIAKGPTASAAPACNAACTAACTAACNPVFRPSVFQHSLRALLHMLQFAVAYFVMLLAMYYNGYIIICIFIGAYIGYFIFGWESMNVSLGGRDRTQEQVTVCCG